MSYFDAIILAIVEGLTEFLPVSSTGHMIIASSLLGIESDSFTKTFTVAIQLGAIVSVLVLYWKRFFQSFNFYFKLLVAFIPAMVFGLLFSDQIDALLENGIELEHACEKSCACSTCHVIVREGFNSLEPADDLEEDHLDKAWGLEPTSRLSCQAIVGTVDLVIDIPKYTVNLVGERH